MRNQPLSPDSSRAFNMFICTPTTTSTAIAVNHVHIRPVAGSCFLKLLFQGRQKKSLAEEAHKP